MILLMLCPLWACWLYLCFIFWCWFWGLQCYISNSLRCASSKACLFTCVFRNLALGASVPHPSAVHAHSLLTHVINPRLRCYYFLKNNQLSFNEIGKWRASFIFTCFRSPAFIALCSSEFEPAVIFPLSQERALAVHFSSFYLCGTVLISSWFLKDVFSGCRVLGWHFFFSTLEMLCCGQACLVPDEKCALVLFLFPRM